MFVQGPPKPWSNEDVFKGLSNKVDELFSGNFHKEFRNAVNKKLTDFSDTKFLNIFTIDKNPEQHKEIKRNPYKWFEIQGYYFQGEKNKK